MSPKPPFPIILPRRHFLFSVSVSIHPSGSGQGSVVFLGAIDVSQLYLNVVLTKTAKVNGNLGIFTRDKFLRLYTQIESD